MHCVKVYHKMLTHPPITVPSARLGKKYCFVGWGVLTLLLEIVVCCRLGCVNIVITSRCLSEGSQLVTSNK